MKAIVFSLLFVYGFLLKANSDLMLITKKIEKEPIISIKLIFHNGSMFDPDGKAGLSALTAQILAGGSSNEMSYEKILENLYPLAARYSVRTDREYVTFSGEVHSDKQFEFYRILRAVLLNPAFDQKDFVRVKSQILNYLRTTLRYGDDEELGKAVFKSFLYRRTPYENPPFGKESTLEKLTVEDVKQFYKNYYTRNRLIIGLSGNYSDLLLAEIKKDFSRLPLIHYKRPQVKPEKISGIEITIVEKKTESTGIHIGFPIKLMRGDADFMALWLANSWFGEHRNSSSHLYKVIREARGLNYGDYSYIEDYPEGGRRQVPPTNVYKNPQLFEIWIRPVHNDYRLFTLKATLRELKKFVDFGLSEEQFQTTKKFLRYYYLNYATTGSERLGYLLDDYLFGIKKPYLDNFSGRLEKLTRKDVNRAIKKYLQAENLRIVIVTENAEELKADLLAAKPALIKYRTPKPQEVLDEDKEIAVFPLPVLAEKISIVKVDDVFK